MAVHLYINNPTQGGTDGTQASEGDNSSPVTNATAIVAGQESDQIVLAVRVDDGPKTVTIEPTGDKEAMWALSAEGVAWEDWGASLILANVGATNVLFYCKTKAVAGETTSDISVKFKVNEA